MQKGVIRVILLMSIMGFSYAQNLFAVVVNIPATTPEGAKIYIAGNFNGWDPGDPKYELIKNKLGTYSLVFSTVLDQIEFKFTMGSWDDVEVDEDGNNIPNRREVLGNYTKAKLYDIKAWHQKDTQPSIVGNVKVINDFAIPQLNRIRRIWVYLPPGYEKSKKHYPVMYMHDGQNLFSDSTSYSGEWGIDETLESMIAEKRMKKMIVVGIENSEHRLSEYCPFDFEYKGEHKGEAREYGEFIVETLKPYIDNHFRTKRDRKHTAISGSSMGGLVSVFIAVEHQDVFSKVGALSSAFGVCRDDLVAYIKNTPKRYPIRFWLDLGSVEAEQMQYDVNQQMVIDALIESGWAAEKEVKYTLYEGAEHHERFWRERFGEVLEFLWK